MGLGMVSLLVTGILFKATYDNLNKVKRLKLWKE